MAPELRTISPHFSDSLLMNAAKLEGFESAGSERPNSIRTIREIIVHRGKGDLADRITTEVTGDGFLYNMVRAIVGTLIEVGKGSRDEAWVAEVLAAQDRRLAGQTAPPHGLFLIRVEY